MPAIVRAFPTILPLFLVSLVVSARCQDDLGSSKGFYNLTTTNLDVRIVRDAQVLASLRPRGGDFDFLPFDIISNRSSNGQYHWGDITYRYREENNTDWAEGDSAQKRRPVDVLSPGDDHDVLAASNLSHTLPSGPLAVTREWIDVDGDIGLRFTIQNVGNLTVEIGSLGFPAEFNSIFSGRTPEQTQEVCSLSEPYIGMDAGQIRVSQVRGVGASLVVTPLNGTKSPLEAYRFLHEPDVSELEYGSESFEGFYEWQVLTKAWAEKEWAGRDPWNNPSSRVLEPGQKADFGVRFSIAHGGVRSLDDTVRSTGTPVAVGIPGYVLPRDLPGQLFLRADTGAVSLAAEPEGSLIVTKVETGHYTVTPLDSAWGRARLTVEYEDRRLQTIHYYITKPALEAIADLGHFLTTEAYYFNDSDPFGRARSVMNYDREERSIISQESRVFVAGLSDESGSSAYLAACLKQVTQPNAQELKLLDDFAQQVLWGHIQLEDSSVRKSLFFYDPEKMPGYDYNSSFDWSQWSSWNKTEAYLTNRAYNYVHPSAAYWSLYRVARYYPDLLSQGWEWYLEQAYRTAIRGTKPDISMRDLGLMGETVWGKILADLKCEGLTDQSETLEDAMKARAEHWNSIEYPFGSEAPWDSTGQEGVYYWASHFGLHRLAQKTVDSVLGFMPSVPHWGWNGNAHRYWDFQIAGKIQNIERQIHHYASTLNAQVLLAAFRGNSSDMYLLRAGHGGSFGSLSNIHQDGCPSAAFHSFPEILEWDAYISDYGQGLLGMTLGSGTYVVEDPQAGLVAYGGILSSHGHTATVQTRDPSRKTIFIGPFNVLITIDAGIIEEFTFDTSTAHITVTLSQVPKSPKARNTMLRAKSTSDSPWKAQGNFDEVRGGWLIPMTRKSVRFGLSPA